MRTIRLLLIITCLVLNFEYRQSLAHPFHTTTAEMEFNTQSGRFEVSLKVLVSDLEIALAMQKNERGDKSGAEPQDWPATPARVDLSTCANADQLILTYLKKNFSIADKSKSDVDAAQKTTRPTKSGTECTIHWVGKEVEKAWVWIYFEITPPQGSSAWLLNNRLFMDLNEGQINTCVVRYMSQRISLKTESQTPIVELPQKN